MDADSFEGKLDLLLAQTLLEAREVGRLAGKVQSVLEAQARSRGTAMVTQVREALTVMAVGAAPAEGEFAVTASWASELWGRHQLPTRFTEPPRFCRIGEFHCALEGDSREAGGEVMPALVPILGSGHVLMVPSADGVQLARQAAAALAVRLLLTSVPGSVWIHPLDPLLAGDSFIELAHFSADVVRVPRSGDGAGGSGRPIEQLLEEVTSHIEEVKTRLPRARRSNLLEYNADPEATPIAYRVILVFDFPYGFDAKGVERLVHIARNGVRAGVHLIVVSNPEVAVPHGFNLDALGTKCLIVEQRRVGAFFIHHPTLQRADLQLDAVPPEAEMSAACWGEAEWSRLRSRDAVPVADKWVHRLAALVADEAKNASRVDVSLVSLRPKDALWQECGDNEVRTPIGRSVERKLQEFVLNEQAFPHALVAGGTGRGKTVLLNAIVVGLCWRYSPEDLELYLIDFKDGIGFQGYRVLPHARLVALKGERELGVHLLKDAQRRMVQRGEDFKRQVAPDGRTVSNIAEWRRATGKSMPRVVIVFDEFQALLRGDDTLGREAAALLADVAGKGREFGIHLILATQTPRQSGITPAIQSQIATRVTLFLEAIDSQIVLAPDNSAASTLLGMGEAIYNRDGGNRHHNHRFQVAFIDKSTGIPPIVAELAALAKERFPDRPPPRVLDGTCPPTPQEATRVAEALRSPPTATPRSIRAYFGAPVDLSLEHVDMLLQPRGQAHLMVYGRNGTDEDGRDCDPMALVVGAMATAALQSPRASLRLASLLSDDDPLVDLPSALRRVRGDVQVGDEAMLKDWLEEIAKAIGERKNAPKAPRDFILLGILSLHRAGCLDGGMKPPALQERLRYILLNGPDVGVHVLAHVEDVGGQNRRLGEAERREFGTRIAAHGSIGRKLFEPVRANPEEVPLGVAWVDRVEQPGPPRRLRTYGRKVFSWLDSLSQH